MNTRFACTPRKLMTCLCLFLLSICVALLTAAKCKLPAGRQFRGISRRGDVMLGAVFPLHFGIALKEETLKKVPSFPGCTQLYPRALRWAMAMAYAIKQINEQNVLLPNITLGHAIYDSCFGVPNTVEAALDYLEPGADNNEPCYFGAVVGAYGSTLSVTLSRFMTLFCIPQLTYASGCKCLSDKRVFPSFLRTFPSDKHQASALADLVQHFGWLYVGTLAVNDDFGRSGVAQFIAEAEDNGVCLAFREILPKVRSDLLIQNLGRIVQRTKANTILLYTNEPDLFPFVEEIIMRNITDKTWLATHPWVSSPILGKKRYAEIFQGSIGFILRRGIVPGLQEFLKSLKPQVTLDYKTSFFRTGLSTDQKRTSSPELHKKQLCHDYGQTVIRVVFGHNDSDTIDDKNGIYSCTEYLQTSSKKLIDTNMNCSITAGIFDLSSKHLSNMGMFDQCSLLNASGCINLPPGRRKSKEMFFHQNNVEQKISIEEKVIGSQHDISLCAFQNKNVNNSMNNLKSQTLLNKINIPSIQRKISEGHNLKNPQKVEPSLNNYLLELWEITFSCSWNTSQRSHRLCTGNEKLDEVESSFTDISQLRFTYNTYMAVNSVAHALHDLHICIPGEGPFGNGSCAHLHDLKPWQLLLYIRKVRFVNNLGENYHFDGNGDSPGVYELLNWQSNDKGSMEFKMVGTYDLRAPINHKLQVNDVAIIWKGGKTKVPISVCNEACPSGTRTITLTGQPFCCFDCIACREGEFSNGTGSEDCIRCPKYFWSNEERSICMPMPEDFMALYDPIALILIILASIALLLTFSVGAIMLQKRESPVVNVTNRHVVGLLLLSVLCSLMSCILFVGKPTDIICQTRETVPCFCITLTFACVLSSAVKAYITYSGKPQMSLMKYFSDFGIICTCVIPQFIYCTIWAIAGFPHVIMNTNMQPGRIVIECAGASLAWPLCAVIYFVLIASVCFGLALKSRNLPVAFNEPKFITFTMMICFLVLFAFVPAYSSTQGKFSLATEMFAIIALSYNLIGCIFMPKCYIALFKNTTSK